MQRPHDRALGEQRLEQRPAVLADVGVEEVRDRRADRLEPSVAERPRRARASPPRSRAAGARSPPASSRLASAASWAALVTSKARFTLLTAVTTSAGATM